MSDTFKIPVSVEVTKGNLDKLSKDQPGTATIERLLQFFLNEYVLGGLMLKADQVAEMQAVLPNRIAGAVDIIAAVQNFANRKEGKFDFTASLDPAFIAPVEELADMQGVSVEGFLADAVNTMMENGWLYSFSPEGGSVRFTSGQMADLRKIIGTDYVTADQVLSALQKPVSLTPIAPPAIAPETDWAEFETPKDGAKTLAPRKK